MVLGDMFVFCCLLVVLISLCLLIAVFIALHVLFVCFTLFEFCFRCFAWVCGLGFCCLCGFNFTLSVLFALLLVLGFCDFVLLFYVSRLRVLCFWFSWVFMIVLTFKLFRFFDCELSELILVDWCGLFCLILHDLIGFCFDW